MPPSPRLSARMSTATSLIVTTRGSDQTTSETLPSTLARVGSHAVRPGQTFLERVERARGDVTEHHTHRATTPARDVRLPVLTPGNHDANGSHSPISRMPG